MKLKHLESMLQEIDGFEEPQVHLEQYPTPVHLAAQIALHITSEQEGKTEEESKLTCNMGAAAGSSDDRDTQETDNLITAADLGCGTGILSIAMILAGAAE